MHSKLRDLIQKWYGIFLALIAAVSTVWLTFNNQLDLYVHPRYVIFNVIFAGLFITAFIAVVWTGARMKSVILEQRYLWGVAFLCSISLLIILILPPASLTSATVSQRGVNASGTLSADFPKDTSGLFGKEDNSEQLTIRDWAALLGQTQDTKFFVEKKVDVTGIIVPDEYDPDNIFYVTRFVVSCCAIDAQPIGVPVYSPGWKEKYTKDDWVKVKGGFVKQNYQSANAPVIIAPSSIDKIKEPDDPYVF